MVVDDVEWLDVVTSDRKPVNTEQAANSKMLVDLNNDLKKG